MPRHSALLLSVTSLAALLVGGCDTLRARALANDAVAVYKKGDLKNAAEMFKRAAALDNDIPIIHLNLGFTYLSLYSQSPKSVEGAQAGVNAARSFQRYLELNPDDPRGRDYLVQTFVDTKSYDDAVIYFKPEVDGTSPSLEAVTTLGLIASKTGHPDDAIKYYQKRVDLAQKDPQGHYNLGLLLWDHLHNHADILGEDRIRLADQGITALQRSVELRPNSYEAYRYLSLLYRERFGGEVDDAKKAADLAEVERYQKLASKLEKSVKPGSR